jgi:hypothetical protein
LFTGFIDAGEQFDFSRDFLQWRVRRKLGNQLYDHFTIAHKSIVPEKRLVCKASLHFRMHKINALGI